VSRRRWYCVTTVRSPKERSAPDLVKRQFVATDINQLWVADMTYIPTWQGFLYLAVVTDVYSRKVVGWAFGARQTADLVVTALNMALYTRKPESVIHHSDQGSQYTSVIFGKRCTEMKVRPSRRHSGLGQISPMAFERKHEQSNQEQKDQLQTCKSAQASQLMISAVEFGLYGKVIF
jgi:putative transposase